MGRFASGTAGGPGRPRRQTEAAYLAVMLDEVTLETWREIVRAAVRDAKNGDHQARNWLARYLVGEPEAAALTPLEVIAQELVQSDPALARAAAIMSHPMLSQLRYLHDEEAERITPDTANQAVRVLLERVIDQAATGAPEGERDR
jgi:hypothetical protein